MLEKFDQIYANVWTRHDVPLKVNRFSNFISYLYDFQGFLKLKSIKVSQVVACVRKENS